MNRLSLNGKMPTVKIDYEPQKHQLEWHNNATRFLVAVCGRQIGKTTAAVNELIKRAIKNPGTRNWYVTVEYAQAKRNVWNMLLSYVPKEIRKSINSTELKVELLNGSRIELIGVQNAETLRGATVDFMILDEYADFKRHVWPEVLRPMLATTAGDVWFIGTPKGMGNDFYDKYFGKDKLTKRFKMPSCEIQGEYVVNLLSKYANQGEIQSAYEQLTKEEFSQEYLADFTRPKGVVYKEWPLENYKKVTYDELAPLHLSWDFGVNDPTAIIWIQPLGGEFRVIDYYEANNANIAHFVQVVKSKPYKEPDFVTGDDAGRARTVVTGTSPIEELSKHGIYVSTTKGLKIPDQIRQTHKHMKSLFVNTGEGDMTKSLHLKRFRDCILNYHYPEISEDVRNQSNEIPVHDEWSHAMRALEYYFVNYKGQGKELPRKKLDTERWSML